MGIIVRGDVQSGKSSGVRYSKDSEKFTLGKQQSRCLKRVDAIAHQYADKWALFEHALLFRALMRGTWAIRKVFWRLDRER
jgi:hypothetical protein